MIDNFNKIFIAKIKELLPYNINLAAYIMKTLSLGKEAAYRRINGQVPFTFEEISQLSLALDLSIDEIVGTSRNKNVFLELKEEAFQEAKGIFLETLLSYYNIATKQYQAKQKTRMHTINQLQLSLLFGFDGLFKFFYYKWIYKFLSVPVNVSFADTIIPAEILSLKKKILFLIQETTDVNAIYLLDQNIFYNAFKDLQYYYGRGLISEDEFISIKMEFHEFINRFEKMTRTSIYHGSTINIFISMLNIPSDNTYFSYDDKEELYFYLYSIYPTRISNPVISTMQKNFLNSLKNQSTLISQCNESFRERFFNKQHEYLEDIGNLPFFSFL